MSFFLPVISGITVLKNYLAIINIPTAAFLCLLFIKYT